MPPERLNARMENAVIWGNVYVSGIKYKTSY